MNCGKITQVLTLFLVSVVIAEQVEPPIRLRFSTGFMEMLFYGADQCILDVFTDIKVSKKGRRPSQIDELKVFIEDQDERCPDINFYQYSIEPIEIKEDVVPDFDYKEQNYYNF